MSSSFTITDTRTFTITHARHLAAKIATDLKRIQRLYGAPSDWAINQYETEAIELLRLGYLDNVTYGFRRTGNWIAPTLRYTSADLGMGNDDDPGRITPGANIDNASFGSYMNYTARWFALTTMERETIERELPIQRSHSDVPGVEGGYFADDKSYSSGGRTLTRASVRNY